MSFVGRSELISYIDDLITAPDGPADDPGGVRPVLVVQGCGGSGRTRLLDTVQGNWKNYPPVAMIVPARLGAPDEEEQVPRPFLSAVWLGFHGQVQFPRLVLAHLAMAAPTLSQDPGRASAEMYERIHRSGSNKALPIVKSALTSGSNAFLTYLATRNGQDAAVAEQARELVDVVAQTTVDGMKKRLVKAQLTFRDAPQWFARQRGEGKQAGGAERALIWLHTSTRKGRSAPDIDDLLVRAFLADLSDAMAKKSKRVANPVLLVDGADGPDAIGFLTALVRVRAREDAEPDPLAVVATSGGPLIDALHAEDESGRRVSCVEDIRTSERDAGRPPPWISLPLTALSHSETEHLVGSQWPAEPRPALIVDAVHRAAAGHPAATTAVLERLRTARNDTLGTLVDDPGTLLPSADAQLQRMVTGLTAGVPASRAVLTTLSAARNLKEAARLLIDPAQLRLGSVVELWIRSDDADRPAPGALMRHLLLCDLARREPTGGGPAGELPPLPDWTSVHRELQKWAAADDDTGGKLYHRLALRDAAGVHDELWRLLPHLDGERWLELLDEVVAVPDLARPPGHTVALAPGETGDCAVTGG